MPDPKEINQETKLTFVTDSKTYFKLQRYIDGIWQDYEFGSFGRFLSREAAEEYYVTGLAPNRVKYEHRIAKFVESVEWELPMPVVCKSCDTIHQDSPFDPQHPEINLQMAPSNQSSTCAALGCCS